MHEHEDEVVAGEPVDGDGPGGDSDVETIAAPQLDDDDAVEISGPGEGAGDPDEDGPAVPAEGHEAEAVMIDDEPEPKAPTVTASVPPVIVENRDSDDLEDSPRAKEQRAKGNERALAEAREAEAAKEGDGVESEMNQDSQPDGADDESNERLVSP